jgi:hypothetical protein
MTISVSANNGKAPASELSVLPGRNGDGSTHQAPHVTAAGYGRVRAAMQGAGMGDLLPSDGWSCYRNLAQQQYMRDIGLTTVPVGQSIHGEWTYGSAVDFQKLGGFGAPRHNWLKAHGPDYGWHQPGWATAGGSLPEPWHWEYDERYDDHIGDPEPAPEPEPEPRGDDEMSYTATGPNGQMWLMSGVSKRPITQAGANALSVLGEPGTVPNLGSIDQTALDTYIDVGGGPHVVTPETSAPSFTATGPNGQLWLIAGVAKRPLTQDGANALSVLGEPATVPYLGSINQTALDAYVDIGGGPGPGRSSHRVDLGLVAIVILLAVVAGVAVGLLSDTRDGVITGVAVIVGGFLAMILRHVSHDD